MSLNGPTTVFEGIPGPRWPHDRGSVLFRVSASRACVPKAWHGFPLGSPRGGAFHVLHSDNILRFSGARNNAKYYRSVSRLPSQFGTNKLCGDIWPKCLGTNKLCDNI